MTPTQSAEHVEEALEAFTPGHGEEDRRTVVCDLLVGLMHLADRDGIDLEAEMALARMHHEAERWDDPCDHLEEWGSHDRGAGPLEGVVECRVCERVFPRPFPDPRD